MAASLPPSSSVTRFTVSEADFMTLRPVAVEPVKATLATSGWAVSTPPRSLRSHTTLNTPGGRISFAMVANSSVVSGVVGAGFDTMVLPASRHGASLFIRRMSGKFHGVMEATTPSGARYSTTRFSGVSRMTFGSSFMSTNAFSVNTEPMTSKAAWSRGLPCSAVSSFANSS